MEKNKRAVLLIEDNSLLTSLYSAVLKKHGIDVVIAHNGEDGLKAINDHKPDVVLLDIRLPGIDGFEVLEKIRSNPETKEIKVIILTISNKEEDKKRATDLGVYDYLTKPEIHMDEIVKKVLTCFNC